MPDKPQIERKLAAIMFTDIVGYTALSAKDSTKASELLKTQRDILKPIVEKHGGSWMKEMGDGLLLTFDSATSAVECSIAIQEATKDIVDLNLRIGLHEGEVIKQDGDVIGDDVNIASRIEPFSAVGGVAISDKIYRAISSNQEFETKYIGKPKLKGVSQEVKVYCITSHGLPETDVSKVSAKLEEESKFNIFALTGGILTAIGVAFWIAIGVFDVSFGGKIEVPSVGILMMENRGAEEDKFWASGITEDLIVKVAGAGLIRVSPMKEILEVDIKKSFEEIAKKLRVKYLLTSSIHKKQDGFDLRCQLIDAETGNSKYANKWSESIDNAPTIVGNLADNILKSLKVSTKQEITKTLTSNIKAYEYYLKGKFKYEKRATVEDIEIARGFFNKALELDTNLLIAKKQLARSYDDANDKEIAIKIMFSMLKQAEQLNDEKEIAYSLASLAHFKTYTNNPDNILEYFARSMNIYKELGDRQGTADIYLGLSYYYKNQIYQPDSILYYSKLSAEIYRELGNTNKLSRSLVTTGRLYRLQKDWDLSLNYYNQALDLVPDQKADADVLVHILGNIAILYEDQRDYDKALEYNSICLNISRNYLSKIEEARTLSSMASTNVIIGKYDNALNYYMNLVKIFEDFDYKINIANNYLNMGIVYFYKSEYSKAEGYLKKAIRQIENSENAYSNIILDYESEWAERTSNLGQIYLGVCYKKLGKKYDISKIYPSIEKIKNSKYFQYDYRNSYYFYILLEEPTYLEDAYLLIEKEVVDIKNELKAKFLSYPIPKAIVEEWEKVK